MADKGWGGLRTRTLAERAGVNKALVHYYFGSMDNLRFETAALVLDTTANEAAIAVMEASTLAEGIQRFCTLLDAFEPEDPSSVVLMETMILAPREPRLAEMMRRVLDAYELALVSRIQADAESGGLPPTTDAAGLATALAALLDGLALHAYMRPGIDFTPVGKAIAALLEPSPPTKRKN